MEKGKDLPKEEEVLDKGPRPEGLDEPEEEFNPLDVRPDARVSPGTVIAIAAFAADTLQRVLTAILSINRKVAIGLKNHTRFRLESINVYFQSGTSDQNISRFVDGSHAGLWGARKSKSTARGSVGVYSYFIQGQNKTVHVMWSVPFDYNLYSNWWSVVVVDGHQRATWDVYNGMYFGTGRYPWPNKPNEWITVDKKYTSGFTVTGNMTSNGEAELEIDLKP